MLITRTPLRISFLGGGTDFRDFYRREGGAVLASAIDKYIFVIIKQRFDERVRVGYTRTELVESVDDLEHELVRECLRKTGVLQGVEISTMGDVPSAGSGMGSSSTVTVGLLHAMYRFTGRERSCRELAEEACEIEIDTLGKPIGVQDQYMVSLGGFRLLTFERGGAVRVSSIDLKRGVLSRLEERLLLFYTNQTRRSESVLTEQQNRIGENREVLTRMKDLVAEGIEALRAGALDSFGSLLHRSWELKKGLASGISNGGIDSYYARALAAGALGGKITGAGGGGFLLLYCNPEVQDRVRAALHDLKELPFRFEEQGSTVILDHPRGRG